MKKIILALFLIIPLISFAIADNAAAQQQQQKPGTICNGKIRVTDFGSQFDAPVTYTEIGTSRELASCHGRRGCTVNGASVSDFSEEKLCAAYGQQIRNAFDPLDTPRDKPVETITQNEPTAEQNICNGKIKIVWQPTGFNENTMRYIKTADGQEAAHCTFRSCVYENCTTEKCKAGEHLSDAEFCEYVK